MKWVILFALLAGCKTYQPYSCNHYQKRLFACVDKLKKDGDHGKYEECLEELIMEAEQCGK